MQFVPRMTRAGAPSLFDVGFVTGPFADSEIELDRQIYDWQWRFGSSEFGAVLRSSILALAAWNATRRSLLSRAQSQTLTEKAPGAVFGEQPRLVRLSNRHSGIDHPLEHLRVSILRQYSVSVCHPALMVKQISASVELASHRDFQVDAVDPTLVEQSELTLRQISIPLRILAHSARPHLIAWWPFGSLSETIVAPHRLHALVAQQMLSFA